MEFSVNRDGFKNVLGVMIKAVSPIATDPRLAGVLIEVKKNGLVLKTTNMDLYINADVPCDVKEEGNILLPARLLFSIFEILPGDVVRFVGNDAGCQIVCEQSVYNLRKIEFDSWFDMPEIKTIDSFKLPIDSFGELAKKVCCAASKDDTRPVLQGINIKSRNDGVALTAFDGYRIATASAKGDINVDKERETVVMGSLLVNLADLSKFGEEAHFSIADNLIGIKCAGFEIVFSKLAGDFPNTEKFFKEDMPITVKVNTNELVKGIQRIALLSSDFPVATLSINPSTNMLHLSGQAEAIGKCDDDIPCECNVKTALKMSFNCKFLLEGLGSIESENTIIKLKEENSAGIFSEVIPEAFTYVLMPVKL